MTRRACAKAVRRIPSLNGRRSSEAVLAVLRKRLADRLETDFACTTVGVTDRASHCALLQIHTRAHRVGADDGHTALQRMRGTIERLAIAACCRLANGFHLAGAFAHERVNQLSDKTSRSACLEVAEVPCHFGGGVG